MMEYMSCSVSGRLEKLEHDTYKVIHDSCCFRLNRTVNGDVFFTTVTHDERNDLRSSRIMSLQYADGALRVTTRNSVYYMSSSDNKNMELIKNFFQESDRLKKLKN